MLRFLLLIVTFSASLSGPIWAQSPIPEKRLTVSRNVDFYGSDLTNIFDTTFKACARACLADDNCKAFTFNQRSNACFPKSDVSNTESYDGAISARVSLASDDALSRAQTRAADLNFLEPSDMLGALQEAETLAERFYANEFTLDQFVAAAADSRNSGNLDAAFRFIGSALTIEDRSDLWVQFGTDALAIAAKDNQRRRQMHATASEAAINAYLRAPNAGSQATALDLLAKSLELRGRGRDMIKPLRLAQSIQPRSDTASRLDAAIAKYGFSISETTVESDLAAPRICSRFSEQLAKGVIYADFVKTQTTGLSVEASGNQICIGGVEHGQRYSFTFRAGLPSISGEVLIKDIELNQYVRDRKAQVRFPGRGYILPAGDAAAVPVIAVNTDTLDLKLFRVSDRNILQTMQSRYFGRSLNSYEENVLSAQLGSEIWRGEGDVETALNEDVTTRLPMRDIVGEMKPGVYALQASVSGSNGAGIAPATQWFVISDLGLTTLEGTDGLHIFVRALSDVSAKSDVQLTLLSRGNEELAQIVTDANGYARIDPGLTRGTGAAAPGLITAQQGSDFAFLSLTDPEFDLSDRGVEGRPAAPPIDVFLTTERGAYRAGETIHALALARDKVANALGDLPLTAILSRPDGVEYARTTLPPQGAGGRIYEMPLAASVPRGTWQLAVYADPEAAALASTNLLVEDFLPERIDFDITAPDGPLSLSGAPAQISIDARYLFGAPAANLRVTGHTDLRAATSLDAYPGYSFGRYDQPVSPRRASLQSGERTDDNGQATLSLAMPEIEVASQPLEAEILVNILEGSGRPVERRITKTVLTDTAMIGIKPLFEGVVGEGTDARFDVIAVNPDLSRGTMPVRWTVNRIETRYQWYSNYGRWFWDPVTTRTRVASGEATLSADAPLAIETPVDWGQYEIRVDHSDGTGIATSQNFYAGWYASADASSTPDLLEASLDAESYKPGDTATLRIVPRYAGTALVTVMSNRLIDMKAVEVSEGENLITFPVTDDWGAGVYVSASVLRPMDTQAGQNPARALGLSYAPVDPGDRALQLSFDGPTEAAPRGPLDVTLNVDGIVQGEDAYVMIAAVDLGILNLTGFEPPSATDHYFGQRKLGMGIRDIYGRLIDGLSGAMGTVRSGGDGGRAQLSAQAPPPTEDLVAYVSGPIKVAADGTAKTQFDLPEFNGTVRLMAVAWSDKGVGNAHKDVLVRDPIVVTATTPRFMAPGDQSQLLLEITHATGPTGPLDLRVSAQGVTLQATTAPPLQIGEGETLRLTVPITAETTGLGTIEITLITPDDTVLRKALTLPIQRNDPIIQRRNQFSLAPGGTFTLDRNLFDGFAQGTASATLSAGPLARFDAPGLLAALDRYPYGCSEQITSRALPLIYLDQVATAMGLAQQDDIAERISQAIDELLNNQSSSGAFGLWRPGRGDFWLDAYVTDFLTRAKARGHDVPDRALQLALDNLRNQLNTAQDFDKGGEGLAYALFVLAREGAASIGDLRYYADVKADAFGTALAMAQVGAALASYGDQTRADAMFRKAGQRLEAPEENQRWRVDYGTDLRDAAAVLTLAVEAGSNSIDRTRIANRVAPQLGDVSTRSTQESVWTLLAANALLESETAQLTMNGALVSGPLIQVLAQDALPPMEITNTGADPTILTVSTFGIPDIPVPAGGNGYKIDRSYFTPDGTPATLDGAKSGDRLVAVLTVTPFNSAEARLMVNDPLPAGFEVDNPNLLRGGDIRALEWLNLSDAVQNTEFRQDRVLSAVDHRSDKPFQLAYILRAIAPGTYHHPAASVEDMYRPSYRARTDTAQVTVLP